MMALCARAAVDVPAGGEIVSRLSKEHPRLLAKAADFKRLRERAAVEPQLKQWHADLRRQADRILRDAPSRYEIPDGLRLLATSRRVLDRVSTLGLLHRLDGDRRYAERAWAELDAAAKFPDWNPRHFLDTAEMTAAFAIGYDWLFDAWTPAQRETLRAAMVGKGLDPALKVYEGREWWAKARHNWNQVCNGGISLGALALGDVEPERAGRCLRAALQSVQLPMAEFAPDGAWGEGPGYWGYATMYNVMLLAALDSSLGTDFGLSGMAGFSKTGDVPVYMSGPAGLSFGYADCHEGVIRAAQMLWLARRFQRPDWARHEIAVAKPHPFHMLWYDAALAKAPAPDPVRDRYFRGAEVVTMRGAWNDANATFVAFKAGDNKFNHSHLDIGTFAVDALGQRWARDLGSDNYNLPGYFGKQRLDYYRLRAEGHNTLVINPGRGPGQNRGAAAKVVRFASAPDRAFAVADLTPAYSPSAKRVLRGVTVLNRTDVLIQDEIEAGAPAEIYWFMHTGAKIELGADRRTATLSLGGALLSARLLSPAGAEFSAMDAVPLPGSPRPAKQGDNGDVRKLTVHLNDLAAGRIAVWLAPSTAGRAPELTALDRW